LADNLLYYGDNLEVLRKHIADESVDLVYLDPPFKSDQNYNVLFAEQDGTQAAAQIQAFKDTWDWDRSAAAAYQETVEAGGKVSRALQAFRGLVGDTPMLAYLVMMAQRLVELRRVMKPTVSVYLHCDPTASHYLKILMDAVFGPTLFRNEIIWKRSYAHNSAKGFGPVHDSLLYYTRTAYFVWNAAFEPLPTETADLWYNNVESGTGRRFNRADLTAAGVRRGSSGAAWRGTNPTAKGRHWAIPGFVRHITGDKDTLQALDALDAAGRIHWPKRPGGTPMMKRYLDEATGVPAQDVITDIPPLHNLAAERLGYPTQKPEALLERIIKASSNEGDTVLDPFCGCGTAVAVAQRLNRRWIGIDITHLAIALIKQRLNDAFGGKVAYKVVGEPADLESARALAEADKFQFQWWAVSLVLGRPAERKKGADKGIDGRLFFHDEPEEGKTKQVIISVKGGHVGVSDVRDLRGVIAREKAEIGVLITLEPPTQPMRTECAGAGFYRSPSPGSPRHPKLQILTIEELLAGKRIDMPAWRGVDLRTFKKAPKAKGKKGPSQPELFDADADDPFQ
jgi:DNA modification methylase